MQWEPQSNKPMVLQIIHIGIKRPSVLVRNEQMGYWGSQIKDKAATKYQLIYNSDKQMLTGIWATSDDTQYPELKWAVSHLNISDVILRLLASEPRRQLRGRQ